MFGERDTVVRSKLNKFEHVWGWSLYGEVQSTIASRHRVEFFSEIEYKVFSTNIIIAMETRSPKSYRQKCVDVFCINCVNIHSIECVRNTYDLH